MHFVATAWMPSSCAYLNAVYTPAVPAVPGISSVQVQHFVRWYFWYYVQNKYAPRYSVRHASEPAGKALAKWCLQETDEGCRAAMIRAMQDASLQVLRSEEEAN